MGDRTNHPALATGVLPFLVSIGFIGVAITIIIGAASFSSLDAGKGQHARLGIGDRVDARSERPQNPANTNAAAVPLVVETRPPAADLSSNLPSSAPQSPTATDALPLEAGVQPAPVEALSGGSLAPPKLDPSPAGPMPAPEQSPGLDTGEIVFPEKATPPPTQTSESHDRSVTLTVAARQLRLRKECGPIREPALHRSCVASFNHDYPLR